MGQIKSLLTSKFKKEEEPEDVKNLRKYQEGMDADGTIIDEDEFGKRRVKWWERILCDKRLRITYVFILCLILGILIPMILFMTKLDSKNPAIYGSCLINNNARFECLINSAEVVTERACTNAMCCWENDDSLPFKCYHSLPSAYHYTLASVNYANNSESIVLETSPSPKSGVHMTSLQTHIYWESESQLVIDIFSPAAFPGRASRNRLMELQDKGEGRGSSKHGPFQGDDDETGNPPFDISWGENRDFYYLKVVRNSSGETIFDTRLGPIMAADDYISISTLLPTEYFYGLKGGQGSFSTLTYAVVNGFENMELPFYMSYEESGMWHGVLLDTNEPMLIQIVQAPAIRFYLETDTPEINLNFFAGPDQADIVSQLHAHIRRKYSIAHAPMIPPYWGLGLHLCRRVDNTSVVIDDIEMLLEENIPFDSDCIDEYFRHPLDFNMADDEELLENITAILETSSKKILISQKVTALADDTNTGFLTDVWLLDANSSNPNISQPFYGEVNNVTVKYIDFFHPELEEFPVLPVDANITVHGFSLDDNFPQLYNGTFACNSPETRIQSWFSTPRSSSNGSSLNSTFLWGSVCPENLHTTGSINDTTLVKHRSLHNTYGERSLKATYESVQENQNEGDEMLISSSSIWTTSLYYGGFNGLQVPFTWQGLKESVEHAVRNYALAPISSTPICGSPVFNMSFQFNEDLCLRWFQFGLLLPLSRNTYHGNSSYGPLRFGNYKDYLKAAIRTRYTFAPYYYTVLHQYETEFLPFIRPMSFHFGESGPLRARVIPLLTQFMIGDAILAAPIVERGGVARSVYLPPGVWYSKEGLRVWNNNNTGAFQQIAGYASETPMFIRGGRIIPTVENEANSILESLKEQGYTLLVAWSLVTGSGPDRHQYSQGMLTVKDNNDTESFHQIELHAAYFPSNETVTISITSTCPTMSSDEDDDDDEEDSLNTLIEQIRIFEPSTPLTGRLYATLKKDDEDEVDIDSPQYYGDLNGVLIQKLGMDWCKGSKYEIIVKNTPEYRTSTASTDTTTNMYTTTEAEQSL